MTTGFAALCWHFRRELRVRWYRPLAPILCFMALASVIFLLPGRSGYVAAVVVIVAALIGKTKQQWRWLVLKALILLACLALLTSAHFSERIQLVVSEAPAHQIGNDPASSAGMRLNYWHHPAQAITEDPLTGFGAGRWAQQYRRLHINAGNGYEAPAGHPHQEFFLRDVLLGAGGIASLAALWRATRSFSAPHVRATRSIIWSRP